MKRRNFFKILGVGTGLAIIRPGLNFGDRFKKIDYDPDKIIYIESFVKDWFEYPNDTSILGNPYRRWKEENPKYYINGRLVKHKDFFIHRRIKKDGYSVGRPYVYEAIFHDSADI